MKPVTIEFLRTTPLLTCAVALFVAVSFGLAGCGSAPSTLALENPTSSTPDQPGSGFVASSDVSHPAAYGSTDTDSRASGGSDMPSPDVDGNAEPELEISASKLVGRWQDSFFGTRTLILRADGTAKMILDLDFAGRLFYGPWLEFDLSWTLEGSRVTIDLLKGEPEKHANSAMNTWGKRYEYDLECVEDHQVQMRDAKSAKNYTLRRVADDSDPGSEKPSETDATQVNPSGSP